MEVIQFFLLPHQYPQFFLDINKVNAGDNIQNHIQFISGNDISRTTNIKGTN